MKQQTPERTKRLAVVAAAAVILVMVLLIIETFRLLLPGLWTAFSSGDEQALSDYLTSEGRLRSFFDAVVPGVRAGGIAGNPGHAGPTGSGDRLWAVERLCDQLFGIVGGKLSGVSAGAPPGKSH